MVIVCGFNKETFLKLWVELERVYYRRNNGYFFLSVVYKCGY